MAGWHHWLDGCESEQTPGVGDGQGGLACCDSWGCKELDTTERLIWSDLTWECFQLQYSCLENPMDGGAWWGAVHGVAKSQTRLGNFTFTFHFHALEKEMATHSSVLAWRIPGTGEPYGLPSMGLHRVGHDWSDLAAVAECFQIILLKHQLGSRMASSETWEIFWSLPFLLSRYI